jgi:hypothetical protein
MISLRRLPPAKWLAVANGLAATAASLVVASQVFACAVPSANQDIDTWGYALLGILVTFPAAALFWLAAAALWSRSPRRWLYQGLAILWPLVVLILFSVSVRKAPLPN